MSVLSVDLHKAIVTVWDANGLNDVFKTYWSSANNSQFPALHDQEAGPAQPFPYCVFSQDPGSVISRMTGDSSSRRFEIIEIPWEFRIHARAFVGIDKSAKQIASELAEDVIKIFGGHPTVVPKLPALENGAVLYSQYQSDQGIRDGDQEWRWVVRYEFSLDIPMAA